MRDTRSIQWLKAARKEFETFPGEVRLEMLRALSVAAQADIAKPFKGVDGGVFEIALKHRGNAFRAIYAVQIGDDVWVIDAFQKKSKSGIKTPQMDVDRIKERIKRLKEPAMSKDDFELVRGSGNVFRDFNLPNADLEQARAILAAKIIGVLDGRKLSVRAAEKLTGVAASEYSRIRNVKLDRFTLDRMITILGKLDQDIEVTIDARSRTHGRLVPA
jgi:phage-related protein/predicted XRE-type DNA-binding protein